MRPRLRVPLVNQHIELSHPDLAHTSKQNHHRAERDVAVQDERCLH
jgi:hypothetical protein